MSPLLSLATAAVFGSSSFEAPISPVIDWLVFKNCLVLFYKRLFLFTEETSFVEPIMLMSGGNLFWWMSLADKSNELFWFKWSMTTDLRGEILEVLISSELMRSYMSLESVFRKYSLRHSLHLSRSDLFDCCSLSPWYLAFLENFCSSRRLILGIGFANRSRILTFSASIAFRCYYRLFQFKELLSGDSLREPLRWFELGWTDSCLPV